MSKVSLRPITSDNWKQCVALTVAHEQKPYVASNVYSLTQAAYQGDWRLYGIYDVDEMVGFIMFGLEEYKGKNVWDICRVMVDHKQQGQGYGSAGLELALEMMRQEKKAATDVYISYLPGNEHARYLYTKLGFKPAGKAPDGIEDLMVMTFID